MGKSSGKKKEILNEYERNPLIDLVIEEASKLLLISKHEILCGNSTTYNAMSRYMIMWVVRQVEPHMPHHVIAHNLNYPNHSSSIDGISRIKEIINFPNIDKKVYVNVRTLLKSVEIEMKRTSISNYSPVASHNWELQKTA